MAERDPIGYGGINLYGYCGGDPVNGVDAEGLKTYIIFLGEQMKTHKLPLSSVVEDIKKGIKLLKSDNFIVKDAYTFNDWNSTLSILIDIKGIYYIGHGCHGVLAVGQLHSGEQTNIGIKPGTMTTTTHGQTISVTLKMMTVNDLNVSNIRKDCEIHLFSCNSGVNCNGLGSIAQAFSNHFGVDVEGEMGTCYYLFGKYPYAFEGSQWFCPPFASSYTFDR